MDIKFPQQENPFPKTFARAIVACVVAFAIGLFIGNALGAFFGTDESVVNTSNYTDRMSAARTVFTDGDQLSAYSYTALTLCDMDGLRLYTSRDRQKVLAHWNGALVDAYSLFDEDIRRSLVELMNTGEALYGVETAAGVPIEDVYLRNIAVEDGVVYYYLYYDDAGYVGLAYDSTREVLAAARDYALPLTQMTVEDPEDASQSITVYEWYITYYIEE